MKRKKEEFEVKKTDYTSEHFLFLWKHFRTLSEFEAQRSLGVEKFDSDVSTCFEVRHPIYNYLIAVGISTRSNMDYAAVDMEFRGKGIQRMLIESRERAIKSLSSSTGLISVTTVVRCSNFASWMNFIKMGYHIRGMTRYGNNEEGFILSKSI